MRGVFAGRYSAKIDGSFVVFLIGMRINDVLAVRKWLPVARAMRPMLRELALERDSGLLHFETVLTWRGVAVVQYWRSFEKLLEYAHAREKRHLPAWAAYNRSVAGNGSVGVWHESYRVEPGGYECVYVNMPAWGLSAAGEHVAAVGRMQDAKSRMEG